MKSILDKLRPYLLNYGVIAQVDEIRYWSGSLHEVEEYYVKDASLKRKDEFSAGRRMIRRIFTDCGLDVGPIKVDVGGAPIFPPGALGSISHVEYYCAVAAGYQCKANYLGIDIEKIGRVKETVWPILFTNREVLLLKMVSESILDEYSTLIYSAKESFIKYYWSKNKKACDLLDISISRIKEISAGFYCLTIGKEDTGAEEIEITALASCENGLVFTCIVE